MNEFINWLKTWDFKAIFYSIIASLIVIIIIAILKYFHKILNFFLEFNYRHIYKRWLKGECCNLIVVGRRVGFSLQNTYIRLDTVISDLNKIKLKKNIEDSHIKNSFVLVGGPGAGKSTFVKKLLLDEMKSNFRTFPLFMRLREYNGYSSIDEGIKNILTNLGVKNSSHILKKVLHGFKPICVLDGLDEVKPGDRDKIINDINIFYHKYFSDRGQLIITCRKEAYRDTPLDIPTILEICPMSDAQIQQYCKLWPLGYPKGKSEQTFWRDLTSTNKIHELARSPLLLVGGLMQYTESNLGIPDERYKYLERVANWLIFDWATAQGHPPDPYRSLYDRLLPKIAFEMHEKNITEFKLIEASKFIKNYMPSYGKNENEVENFIDSLRTKTGIIVHDDNNNLIFSQFSLQEYFASLEIIEKLKPDEIGKLSKNPWWREVILLAIAQQKNPDMLLDTLFKVEPTLAASAVAECPTPSIEQQSNAISECLKSADNLHDNVKTPLVQLLRKVQDIQLDRLCKELEQRLKNVKTSKFIGIILATAGTNEANTILSKHPEIWEDCLADAGYLSDSFENLLFEWIENGNENQCFKATDIIITRFRVESFNKLLNILPKISIEKANYLAIGILSFLLEKDKMRFNELNISSITIISACVPYLIKPQNFIKNKIDLLKKALKEKLILNDLIDNKLFKLISTMIYLKILNNKSNNVWLEKSVKKTINFCFLNNIIILWIISSLSLLFILSFGLIKLLFLSLILLFLLISLNKQFPRLPWVNNNYFLSLKFHNKTLINLSIIFYCILSTISFFNPTSIFLILLTNYISIIPIIIGLILIGESRFRVITQFLDRDLLSFYKTRHIITHENLIFINQIVLDGSIIKINIYRIFSLILIFILFINGLLKNYLSYAFYEYITLALSLIIIIGIIIFWVHLGKYYYSLKIASKKSYSILKNSPY